MNKCLKINKIQFCKIMIFVIFLSRPMLSGYVSKNMQIITFISNFFTAFMLLGIGYVIIKNLRVVPLDYVCLIILILCSYYITIKMFPIYKGYIESEFWGPVVSLYQGVSGYFIVRFVNSEELIWKALKISAFVLFAFYFIQSIGVIIQGYWIILYQGKLVTSQYNMAFGYNMLLPTLVFLFRGMDEKKNLYIIFSIIGCLEILLLGSRGALIGIPIFFLLYMFLYQENRKKRIIAMVIISFSVMVLYFLYVPILKVIANAFEVLGFSSRSIIKMLEGTFTNANTRDFLYSKTIEMIKQNPLGNGILSDRYYVGQYCHNIFLEILLDFGILLGSVFIVIILFLYIRALVSKQKGWKGLFIVFFCASFFRLLVSYSFWLDSFFWMTIAIAIILCRRKSYLYGSE